MAKFAPDPLWTALREAGLADDATRRVVIDVQSGHLPIVHTERYGDDGLLNVVAIAGRVEILRDGPSPVPEKPAEPLTGLGAGGPKPEGATAVSAGGEPDRLQALKAILERRHPSPDGRPRTSIWAFFAADEMCDTCQHQVHSHDRYGCGCGCQVSIGNFALRLASATGERR